jgi:hypothetical protein
LTGEIFNKKLKALTDPGILQKGNLSEQKKIWREKNQLCKKVD